MKGSNSSLDYTFTRALNRQIDDSRWGKREKLLELIKSSIESMNTVELENAYYRLTGEFLE